MIGFGTSDRAPSSLVLARSQISSGVRRRSTVSLLYHMTKTGQFGICLALSILACAIPSRGHAQTRRQVASSHLAVCYRASYTRPTNGIDSTMLPPRIELGVGRDSGAVRSAVARGDTLGFWRMFLVGGRWARNGRDSVQLNFTNGFSSVVVGLAIRGDSLEGTTTFYYDAVGQPIPTIHAVLHRAPCRLTKS